MREPERTSFSMLEKTVSFLDHIYLISGYTNRFSKFLNRMGLGATIAVLEGRHGGLVLKV